MAAVLRSALGEKRPDGRDGYEVVAAVLVALALAGDLDAIELVFDRIDGRPPKQRHSW